MACQNVEARHTLQMVLTPEGIVLRAELERQFVALVSSRCLTLETCPFTGELVRYREQPYGTCRLRIAHERLQISHGALVQQAPAFPRGVSDVQDDVADGLEVERARLAFAGVGR